MLVIFIEFQSAECTLTKIGPLQQEKCQVANPKMKVCGSLAKVERDSKNSSSSKNSVV